MNFQHFVRRPFTVEAVQITDDNIDDICKLIGTEVKLTDDGRKYIVIDKRIVPYVTKVYTDWWLTRLDENMRCYNPRVFRQQFLTYSPDWEVFFEGAAQYDEETGEEPAAPAVGAYGRIQVVVPASAMDQ